MTDADVLLTTILLHPDDDLPRLVYADFIEEGGDAARAEFIRIQCDLAKQWSGVGGCTCRQMIDKYHCNNCMAWDQTEELRDRERELFAGMPLELPDGVFRCVSTVAHSYSRVRSDPLAIYRRGFVESVRLPLAAFMGGLCDRCRGTGRHGGWIEEPACRDCQGVGRIEGVAKRLFQSQPVTRVEFTDVETILTNGRQYLDPARIPTEIFSRLKTNRYPTTELAIAALSDAAVAYGRSLADLPPLRKS